MNPNLFAKSAPVRTAAGGEAFELDSQVALTKMILNSTLHDSFYYTASEQLNSILLLCGKVSPTFIAQLAVFASNEGKRKDTPALLLAVLSKEHTRRELFAAFHLMRKDGKLIRNYFSIIRSGVVGRRNFGTMLKRLVGDWFNGLNTKQFTEYAVGNEPSLGDVIKLVRPIPKDEPTAAMFRWVMGKAKEGDDTLLPAEIVQLKAYLRNPTDAALAAPTGVSSRYTANIKLSIPEMRTSALTATWNQIRQSLNTYVRDGLFDNTVEGDNPSTDGHDFLTAICTRLLDFESMARARVYPYDIMNTIKNLSESNYKELLALQLYMCVNESMNSVTDFKGKRVLVAIDVSGSMQNAVNGNVDRGRKPGAPIAVPVSCTDVSVLYGISLARKNPNADLIAFDDRLMLISPDDIKNNWFGLYRRITAHQGSATYCQLPLQFAIDRKKTLDDGSLLPMPIQDAYDYIVFISDNETFNQSRTVNQLWQQYRTHVSPECKLVLWDLTPNQQSTVPDDARSLNIGGTGTHVFESLQMFADGLVPKHAQIDRITAIDLYAEPLIRGVKSTAVIDKVGIVVAADGHNAPMVMNVVEAIPEQPLSKPVTVKDPVNNINITITGFTKVPEVIADGYSVKE